MAVSDLVILYNSTVGAEAVYFDKPLIVMDYSNNDFSGFIEACVTVGCTNFEGLESNFAAWKAGEIAISVERQQSFVKERAEKIDGLVSRRIIDHLKGL